MVFFNLNLHYMKFKIPSSFKNIYKKISIYKILTAVLLMEIVILHIAILFTNSYIGIVKILLTMGSAILISYFLTRDV